MVNFWKSSSAISFYPNSLCPCLNFICQSEYKLFLYRQYSRLTMLVIHLSSGNHPDGKFAIQIHFCCAMVDETNTHKKRRWSSLHRDFYSALYVTIPSGQRLHRYWIWPLSSLIYPQKKQVIFQCGMDHHNKEQENLWKITSFKSITHHVCYLFLAIISKLFNERIFSFG